MQAMGRFRRGLRFVVLRDAARLNNQGKVSASVNGRFCGESLAK
jgi:hypothetical protein